jgi:putative endonuclease
MWTVLRRLFTTAGWLGEEGERAAARFLRRKGFRIVERRARNRYGEIDLVALDGETIVFVEVKTRGAADRGAPFDAVTPDKQRTLTRAAMAYLKRQGWLERRCRFDVVSVVWPDGAARPEIEHFAHAFEAVGRGQFYS